MPSLALMLAAGTVLLLLLLALKLRGPRGPADLTGPPKKKRKVFSPHEARQLAALVASGDEEGALRRIRAAGYGEAEARKVVDLIARLETWGEDAH